ncbi:MAG: 2Fe-2S iron-sulfur cluster-binding protein [Burkholderiaceae bacterium]
MKSVTFSNDGSKAVINTQERLLDALLAKSVPVKMLCRGRGLCATCHVYVTKGAESLTPLTEREKLTLSMLTGAQANSRLACQSKVLAEGVEVSLPRGLYVESFSEIESLVGKRTSAPILHPVSGKVLIQENKIITRSAISELREVDFDVRSVDAS